MCFPARATPTFRVGSVRSLFARTTRITLPSRLSEPHHHRDRGRCGFWGEHVSCNVFLRRHGYGHGLVLSTQNTGLRSFDTLDAGAAFESKRADSSRSVNCTARYHDHGHSCWRLCSFWAIWLRVDARVHAVGFHGTSPAGSAPLHEWSGRGQKLSRGRARRYGAPRYFLKFSAGADLRVTSDFCVARFT